MTNPPLKVLTIAGSDSGGGAGIQADLKTFHSLGVYGFSAITALTAQNTIGVFGIQPAENSFFKLQLQSILSDISPDAVKTGMLANAKLVKITANLLSEFSMKNIVVDPVMISKQGAKLLEDDAIESYQKLLFPIAEVITPNLSEASLLSGVKEVNSKDYMKSAAEKLIKFGCKNVVIKGGHLKNHQAVDLFFNGEKFIWLECDRISNKNTHGTGCTFSSAIAVFLAYGETPFNAVKLAKGYITSAIKNAFPIGKGIGPVNHLWCYQKIDKITFPPIKIVEEK